MIAGIDLGHAGHVLDDLAELIRGGRRLEVGDRLIDVPGAVVSIGAVHPVHIANGLMNLWFAHADRRGDPSEPSVVQALVEPLRENLRLDRPYTNLGHRGRGPGHRRRR